MKASPDGPKVTPRRKSGRLMKYNRLRRVMNTPLQLSIAQARRIALSAQGFDRGRQAHKIRARDISRVIRTVGLLQIDYVNVLIPAQYQVIFSRLGPYRRTLLDEVVYGG